MDPLEFKQNIESLLANVEWQPSDPKKPAILVRYLESDSYEISHAQVFPMREEGYSIHSLQWVDGFCTVVGNKYVRGSDVNAAFALLETCLTMITDQYLILE